jgi:hypothetical protein
VESDLTWDRDQAEGPPGGAARPPDGPAEGAL